MANYVKIMYSLTLKNQHISILPHNVVNSNRPNKTNLWIHENGCLNQNIRTCQTFVKIVKNCKYLVIEMCHNLKWNDHIKHITNKLRKLMYAFKNLTDILELKTIKVVYQTLMESKIDYGISVWGGTYDTTIGPTKKKYIIKY